MNSTGYIAVGNEGTGTLAMSDDATMSVQYDFNVGDLGGANGTFTLADRAAVTAGSSGATLTSMPRRLAEPPAAPA